MAKPFLLHGVEAGPNVVLRVWRGTSYFVTLQHVSKRVESRFVWQAQYFGCVHLVLAWQAQHATRIALARLHER
jgi:hypothetical protein